VVFVLGDSSVGGMGLVGDLGYYAWAWFHVVTN